MIHMFIRGIVQLEQLFIKEELMNGSLFLDFVKGLCCTL